MPFFWRNREIKVYTVCPNVFGALDPWHELKAAIHLAEKSRFSGVLFFEGNDVAIDPWAGAQYLLENTRNCVPLVALNPLHAHPFKAAKYFSALQKMYGRPISINFITGTAISHHRALGDRLDKSQRAERLDEYISIFKELVSSSVPVSVTGRHYSPSALKLPVALKGSGPLPEMMISGSSDASKKMAREQDCISMTILMPGKHDRPGYYFGVITRLDEMKAWKAATTFFKTSREHSVSKNSPTNTDSQWKLELFKTARLESEPSFWLQPFLESKADCPYLVGSHALIQQHLVKMLKGGMSHMIVDIPSRHLDYRNFNEMLVGVLERRD